MDNFFLREAKRATLISVEDIEQALKYANSSTTNKDYAVQIFFLELKAINERRNGKRVYTSIPIDLQSKYPSAPMVHDFWDDVIADIPRSIFNVRPIQQNPPPMHHVKKTIVSLEQFICEDEVFYLIRTNNEDLEYSTFAAVEDAVAKNDWIVTWNVDGERPKSNIIMWSDDIDIDVDTTLNTYTGITGTTTCLTVNNPNNIITPWSVNNTGRLQP